MDIEGSRGGPSPVLDIRKMDLVLVLKSENFYKQSSSKCVGRLTSYILDKFSEYKLSNDSVNKIKCVLKVFVSKLLQKWKKSNWSMERFMKCNSKWLTNDLVLLAIGTTSSNSDLCVKNTRGRPAKAFEESSLRTKRRNQGSNGKIFCPKCNTEVPHTAEGIHEDQTKILVAKVYHYFEQEYEQLKTIYGDLDLTPLSKFRQRTALATGVSETTVLQILKEEEDRNSDKRQEPTETRRRARKRSHTDSSSDEDSSDDNVDDGGQSSFVQLAQDKPEIETLVVKLESPEHYKEQTQPGPLLAEVKSEPPNDDENNTEETLALNEPAGTKRKATKIPRSDVTPTLQHTQGESSTTAAASSARLAEGLHESVRLGEREVKVENVETLVEEGFS